MHRLNWLFQQRASLSIHLQHIHVYLTSKINKTSKKVILISFQSTDFNIEYRYSYREEVIYDSLAYDRLFLFLT